MCTQYFGRKKKKRKIGGGNGGSWCSLCCALTRLNSSFDQIINLWRERGSNWSLFAAQSTLTRVPLSDFPTGIKGIVHFVIPHKFMLLLLDWRDHRLRASTVHCTEYLHINTVYQHENPLRSYCKTCWSIVCDCFLISTRCGITQEEKYDVKKISTTSCTSLRTCKSRARLALFHYPIEELVMKKEGMKWKMTNNC